MKPKFSDIFYIVNEEAFKPRVENYSWNKEFGEAKVDYIRYNKVIPVYVKCVSDMYDGGTEFDITPVDIRDGKKKNWRWSRSISDGDIDKTVFTTEAKAKKHFEKTFSEEQRKIFKEKEQYHKLNGERY